MEEMQLQYRGSTFTQFKVCFQNHKSPVVMNKKSFQMAVLCKASRCNLKDTKFVGVIQVMSLNELKSKYTLEWKYEH